MLVGAEYALIYFLEECLFVLRSVMASLIGRGCGTSCESTVSCNGIAVESMGKASISVDSKRGYSGDCGVASGLTSTREHLRV